MGKNVLIERDTVSETAAKFGMTDEEARKLLATCRAKLHAERRAGWFLAM